MAAFLETVEINHPHAKAPKIIRLSRNITRVIDLMIHEGAKLDDALITVGITRSAYLKASFKPEFIAYQGEAMRVKRTHAAARTIAKAEMLMDGAESEHVQADMTKWLAGLEGISPIARSESVNVHKVITPGLTIMIGGWAPHEITPAEQQAIDITPSVNRIGAPQPHPSRIVAQPTTSGVEPVQVQPGTKHIE